MKKAYENIGLTKEDVLEIQRWMFPMMSDTKSVSGMIKEVASHYEGTKQHYALYLLGSELGQAHIKQQLKIDHELDPDNV